MLYNLENYEQIIFPDKNGGNTYYIATTIELPAISGCGDTPDEAYDELKTVFKLAYESFKEDNEDMPHPLSDKKFSGQFRIRIPRDLHYELAKASLLQKISINQLVNYLLTKGVNKLH
ncbi:MAG: toxin-antitoxin system HicB family antitoxin [Candidatus Eremiobacteraeota bacterium]|nr:toxin-antitoxin system HicB family antitoxin [Candidatus Eremiobacteraeota bacterium]